jgi:hypothetical protein
MTNGHQILKLRESTNKQVMPWMFNDKERSKLFRRLFPKAELLISIDKSLRGVLSKTDKRQLRDSLLYAAVFQQYFRVNSTAKETAAWLNTNFGENEFDESHFDPKRRRWNITPATVRKIAFRIVNASRKDFTGRRDGQPRTFGKRGRPRKAKIEKDVNLENKTTGTCQTTLGRENTVLPSAQSRLRGHRNRPHSRFRYIGVFPFFERQALARFNSGPGVNAGSLFFGLF